MPCRVTCSCTGEWKEPERLPLPSTRDIRTYQSLRTLAHGGENSSPRFLAFLIVYCQHHPYIPAPGSHLICRSSAFCLRWTSLLLHILPEWIHSFPFKNDHLYIYDSYNYISISEQSPEFQIYGSSFLDVSTWILTDPSNLKAQNQTHCLLLHLPTCLSSRVSCTG